MIFQKMWEKTQERKWEKITPMGYPKNAIKNALKKLEIINENLTNSTKKPPKMCVKIDEEKVRILPKFLEKKEFGYKKLYLESSDFCIHEVLEVLPNHSFIFREVSPLPLGVDFYFLSIPTLVCFGKNTNFTFECVSAALCGIYVKDSKIEKVAYSAGDEYLEMLKTFLKEKKIIKNDKTPNLYLSKSQFIRGNQCLKSLWLYKNKREVLTPPSQSELAAFQTGNEVGELAQKLFPNGVKIDFEGSDFSQKIAKTKELINSGTKAIYEATFSFCDVLVMVDILEIGKDGVVINEVKSSTSVKDVYVKDLAIQFFVLNGLGYNIKAANLIHINNQYERKGALDIKQLFVKENLYDCALEFQGQIMSILDELREGIKKKNEPKIDIGAHCFDPYSCDGMEYCWEIQRGIKGSENVFNISRLRFDSKMKMYKNNEIFFKDIKDFSLLNERQKQQVECTLKQKSCINKAAILEFLKTLKYPIYHLDFETFQSAIPKFEGARPYAQIPFQYSIHIESKNGALEHREFLAESGSDPRRILAEKLLKDIPQDSCILAYNASFERGVIKNLALQFSDLSDGLLNLADNILDLMIPFQNGDYYTPKMGGSYSIKAVLPALCPDFENAYKDLELIQNGGQAMEAYPAMAKMDEPTREKYKRALLAYCHLDTLAMVKVLEQLRSAVKK